MGVFLSDSFEFGQDPLLAFFVMEEVEYLHLCFCWNVEEFLANGAGVYLFIVNTLDLLLAFKDVEVSRLLECPFVGLDRPGLDPLQSGLDVH